VKGQQVRDQYRDQYLVEELTHSSTETGFYPDYWHQVESEDKLGCARGVVWAVLFETAVAVVTLLCWKLHLWPF
jgi:hypothetical protein